MNSVVVNASKFTPTSAMETLDPLVYSGNHGNSSGDDGLVQIGIAARGRQGCLREFNYAAFIRIDHKDVYTWIVCVILFIGKCLHYFSS